MAKLLGSLQPSIKTAANSNTLAEKAVVEAFRTGRDEVVPEPERFSEHMLAGLYSKMDRKGDAEGTSESPLSVGTESISCKWYWQMFEQMLELSRVCSD